ncbi:hypothetical protein [Streptomyces sp. NPDC053755]|uniref:hypothetical protein n=1 Tax=Streptomyces sp. NPDC053755 TaxID=3155815 RepID=UPI003439EFB7
MNQDEPTRPPHEPLLRTTSFTPEDEARHRQDFLAGTVFVAAAGTMAAGVGAVLEPLDPLFVVYVHEDERTFGAAPQLREAFALLDRAGAADTYGRMEIATGWSGMGGRDPLLKLHLRFPGPRPSAGAAELVLPGRRYAAVWQHVVDGGLIGISSQERMARAVRGPEASFADGIDACVLLATGSSPVLDRFIDAYGWPRRARSTPC